MDSEIQAMLHNKTWVLTDLPVSKKVVGCKWVYTIKFKADGSLDRYKVRLVAKGYSQIPGLNLSDTFSAVAKLNSVRLLISLGANFDLPLDQLDVKNTFLHGDLQEEVCMQQLPGYVAEGEPYMVCKLHKSIYELKQSPRARFEKFSSIMLSFEFVSCISNYSVFVKNLLEDVLFW